MDGLGEGAVACRRVGGGCPARLWGLRWQPAPGGRRSVFRCCWDVHFRITLWDRSVTTRRLSKAQGATRKGWGRPQPRTRAAPLQRQRTACCEHGLEPEGTPPCPLKADASWAITLGQQSSVLTSGTNGRCGHSLAARGAGRPPRRVHSRPSSLTARPGGALDSPPSLLRLSGSCWIYRPTRAAPGTRSHSRKSEVPWLRTLCPCSCPNVLRASTVRTALSPSSTPSFSVPGGRPRLEQPECWGRCGAQPPGLHRGPRAVSSGPGRTLCPVESGGLAGRPRDLTEGPCGCHLRPQSGGPRSRSRPSVQTHSCCKGGVVGVSSGRSVDRGAGRRGCGAKTSVTAADALVQAAP